MLFGLLMQSLVAFGEMMISGLNADEWSDAVEPRFKVGLDLDEVFAFGRVFGKHQAEADALFDDPVLAEVRRR